MGWLGRSRSLFRIEWIFDRESFVRGILRVRTRAVGSFPDAARVQDLSRVLYVDRGVDRVVAGL